MLEELLGIQGLPKEGLFNKDKGVEINGAHPLSLSDISPCLEIQATHELPNLMLLRTASISLAIAAKVQSLMRLILVHPTSLPWHPCTTGMACLGYILGKRGWICTSLNIKCYLQ